jgi:hypothetical protein
MIPGRSLLLAILVAATGCSSATPVSSSSPTGTTAPVELASPTPDKGDHVTMLPVTTFGHMVVDPKTKHVFVSSPEGSAIVVLDYSANIVRTISNEAGADGMVVSGTSLYVALSTPGAIDEISTTQLSKIRTVTSGLVQPADLALAGGRLWTTTGACANWSTELVSVDLVTGATKTYPAPASSNLSYCAAFAGSPALPNLLLAWDHGLSPATITEIDVSTGEPVVVVSRREEPLGNLQGIAITSDGSLFITASGAPYEFDEWRVSDLAEDGVIYPGMPYPIAVAVNGDGKIACALWLPTGWTLREYLVGRPDHYLYSGAFGSQTNLVFARGLAFTPDGSRLLVVTGDQDIGEKTVIFNSLAPRSGSNLLGSQN